jgi:hypothetical protein
MSKQKKIISIVLILGFIFAAGIFLYPGKEPKVGEQGVNIPEGAGPQQFHQRVSDMGLKNEPAVKASPTDEAGLLKKISSDNNSYVVYPEKLLELLGIDMEKVIAQRDAFKNTVIHVEWMDRINEVLKNLDPQKKEAIIKNHLSHLYIKDLLNEAYLSGKIDHETFVKAVADLMKWHQKTYEAMLTSAEYEALFEVKSEAADGLIDEMLEATPKYSFILNQQISTDEVAKQVQGFKLEQVDSHFKKMILDREQIGKKINKGEMTLEQAREALYQSQQVFIARCKELLTDEEINTIFGSVAALESGGTQPEPPGVMGDSDIIELGFMIENPTTSIDMVKEKIDKKKLEDIKFFYQQMDQEKQELIAKLDAGEIKEDVFDNHSNEMDKTFEENCRIVLTDEEYKLIFDRQAGVQTQPLENKEIQSMDAEPEKSSTPVKR